jgi:putative transposase
VENIHNNTSSFLAKSVEELILPKLDLKNMIKKEKRNLNKRVVNDIIYKSPYKLHCKIVDQCSKYNTNIIKITEEYTSKTCGFCFNRKTKEELKGERIYECKKCGITMDRDYNAARNIMLKHNKLFSA